MIKKILFIDSVHPILKQKLEEEGFVCEEDFAMSREKLIAAIPDYFGIVVRSRIKLDREILKAAKNLKFIARSGAGMENIDFDFAQKQGIKCFNAPEGNRDAVGEHALGMLLSLFNHLKRGDSQVRNGIWKREENRGIELGGKTVGIIGFGNTGQAFAAKLSGFDCRILAYDKHGTPKKNATAKAATLSDIFNAADVVSFHVPLTEETHHYFNHSFLESFQKPIFLINTSRGQVVKTEALVDGLKSGSVAGACLDVLEYEKFSFEQLQTDSLPEAFSYLISSEKVLLSPHVAGWTNESYLKLSDTLARKILAEFSA